MNFKKADNSCFLTEQLKYLNPFCPIKEIYNGKVFAQDKYPFGLIVIDALSDEKHANKYIESKERDSEYKISIYETPFGGYLKVGRTNFDKKIIENKVKQSHGDSCKFNVKNNNMQTNIVFPFIVIFVIISIFAIIISNFQK